MLDGLAGLLAAGMLVLGTLLLLAALIAPGVLSAAGLGEASGPGWSRVVAHLAIGVVGELVVRLRPGRPPVVRMLADAVVVLTSLAVLGWAWLP